MPDSQILLSSLPSENRILPLVLNKPVSIGRAKENDIVLPEWMVSKQHCQVTRTENGYLLKDLGSANGTHYRNQLLAGGREVLLKEGETFWVGSQAFQCIGNALNRTLLSQQAGIPTTPREDRSNAIPIGRGIVLGRDAAHADVALPDHHASRKHCKIEPAQNGYLLTDLGSANGTFYPKERRLPPNEPVSVPDGAIIYIVDTPYLCSNGSLLRLTDDQISEAVLEESAGIILEVQNLTIAERLAPVSFMIPPGKSVAIVGASGSGKSTLLKALTGVRPATDGYVLLNGRDYYALQEVFRSNVGYVPQKDVMHQEITLLESLEYTARLRMPSAPDSARQEVISETLDALDLAPHKDKRIGQLSGGQQKRVNVAMELLTRPGLLYMDEPTSGLDPVSEHDFLKIVRACTERGCTVIIVTHSEAVVNACDYLAVIGVQTKGTKREGYLSYFGEVSEGELHNKYGGADLFTICQKAIRPAPPEDPKKPAHRRTDGSTSTSPTPSQRDVSQVRQDAIKQFSTLTERYVLILRSERRWGIPTFVFLFGAQAVAIPVLLALLFPPNMLSQAMTTGLSVGAVAKEAMWFIIRTMMYPMILALFLVLFTTMFGILATTNEIVKEHAVYLRERLSNLQRASYLGSKLLVWFVLCLVHSILLLAVISMKVDFGSMNISWTVFIPILAMNAIVSAIIGLIISAYAQSSYQAIGMACGVVFTLILFSGIVPMQGTSIWSRLFQVLSEFSPSYWSFGALCKYLGIGLNQQIERDTALIRMAILAVLYLLVARAGLVRKERRFHTSEDGGRALG